MFDKLNPFKKKVEPKKVAKKKKTEKELAQKQANLGLVCWAWNWTVVV